MLAEREEAVEREGAGGRTAITLMLTSGIPVHVVAACVGDTPATVLSTYAHLLPQSDEVAAERVAALIV
jgi:hypothetical protein